MAKKKTDKEVKRPENTGLAAFREYQKKISKGVIEEELEAKTAEDIVSSGAIIIDTILGTGGFVKGTMHEIAGEAHSGKTTLMLQTARNIQRAGGVVAYLNFEKSLDKKYTDSLGVNTDSSSGLWYYSTHNSYEGAASMINGLINVGEVSAIFLDSIAGLETEEALDDDTSSGSKKIGQAAAFWSTYFKKLADIVHKKNVLFIFANQTRLSNIGVYGSAPVKDTTGGNAVKFWKTSAVYLQGSKPKAEESVDEFGDKYYRVNEDYTKVVAKVDKNKWGPSYKSAIGRIVPYVGYDNYEALYKLAVMKGVIEVSGAWVTYRSENDPAHFKVQGRDAAQERIKNNPHILKKLVEDVGLAKPENYFPNTKF